MSDGVVIVGGGPAAQAAASAYREAGAEGPVTILAAELELPYERPPLTKEYLRGESSRGDLALAPPTGNLLLAWLGKRGVTLLAEAELAGIDVDPGGAVARFGDGRECEADAVLLALGISRNDELAAAAGIEVDDGVPIDEGMVSAHPRLLAAGDVAFAGNGAAGRPLRIEHRGEALNQGRVAGRALAGEKASWDVVPGFWSMLGKRTLKYAGWGDGWDEVRFEPGAGEGFTASYGRGGELVGVLAHEDDAAYEEGKKAIEEWARWR